MPDDVLQRHNVRITGAAAGPAMVFGHGFGCDQAMWRFVAPAFEADYRCILFDHAGCGKADPSAYSDQRHGRLEGYAEDVLDVLAALDLNDVIFIGHSVSAMIGVVASIAQPSRFGRLALIAPSPRYIDDPPRYVGGFQAQEIEELMALMERNPIGWANLFAPVAMSAERGGEVVSEFEASLRATDQYAARRFARLIFLSDYREKLREVRTPSLVVQCARDTIAPMAVGRFVHEQIPGSVLTVIDAAGHCPHMSHPKETIAALKDYLGRP